MADTVSIEETNKIRKSLGLPLLPVPGQGPVFKEASDSGSDSDDDPNATLERREAQAENNYKRALRDEQDKAAREKRKDAVRKARELAARSIKLEGKGLGEEDDEQDTRSWLIGQKKRQKRIEKEREKLRKTEEELKARELQAYTSKDLAGVRVAHELGDFENENEHVLVLKDTTIDENEEEGDELENVDLKDQERRNERLDLKKKKPVYNPNDIDPDGEQSVLKQYDEVIEGKKRKRFTLDADGQTVEQKEDKRPTLGEQVQRQAISLDILKELPKSDYAEPKEVKIRKPKKQKKSTRKKAADDEDDSVEQNAQNGARDEVPAVAMDVDGDSAAALPERKTAMFLDDDDLQASLARQRREALKKRKKMRPEDLAKQLRDEQENAMQEDESEEDGGLVIDETTFFVDNIDERQRELEEEREASRQRAATQAEPQARTHEADISMADDTPMANTAAEPTELEAKAPPAVGVGAGLDSEATFNKGLGGVFSFVKDRGMWDAHADESTLDDTRASQMFRSQKRRMETEAEAKARAQRLAGRETGKYQGHSQREREEMHRKENEQRQFQESQRLKKFYEENYKPSFTLTHKDEFGREMNEKEAFKHLSHQFHGKGSGKMKTEKRLKKIDEEKKAASKSLLDNTQMSNYSNAADATSKKRGTFGVQLGK